MPENYHTENVIFDITEVNLPFNAIIGRPALYQFVAIAHYGYQVMKMPSTNGIIKIRGDRTTGIFALEKLQTLAAAHGGWPTLLSSPRLVGSFGCASTTLV
jgi:hypothetical protein